MKPANKILAIIAAVGATTASAAPVVLHITGSTAFRAQTNLAIVKSFDSGTTVNVGTSNASLGSSGASYFHGTMGGVDVIVETKFTGSTGGIKAVTSGALLEFFPDNLDTVSGATVGIVTGTSPTIPTFSSGNGLNATPSGVNTVAAEMTMADTYQSATLYRTPVLAGATITGSSNDIVGVIPFVWIRTPSSDAPLANLTNMTNKTANLLYGNGTLPLAFWSGLASDETNIVYGAGRDPDSGTRLSTFAESGLGANATVVQYNPSAQNATAVSGVSTSGQITGVQVFPDTNVVNLGQTFVNGNAGEASGGTLAGYMSKAFNTGTPGALVAYLSYNDAAGAIQAGAVPLTWNGVSITTTNGLGNAPTFDFTNIRNGKYTFWAYEHVLFLSGTPAAKKTVANKIATQIFTTDAPVLISSMRVSRQVDGGIVGPRY